MVFTDPTFDYLINFDPLLFGKLESVLLVVKVLSL